jgi:hypothetical protein
MKNMMMLDALYQEWLKDYIHRNRGKAGRVQLCKTDLIQLNTIGRLSETVRTE